MQAHPGETQIARLETVARASGFNPDAAGGYTGAVPAMWTIRGYLSVWRYQRGLSGGTGMGGLGASITNIPLLAFPESYRGRCSRSDFGGYNYDQLTVWGSIDNMAASWLCWRLP